MGLQEQIQEFNQKPNARYVYLGVILALLFLVIAIKDPVGTIGMIFSIISLAFWLAVCYFIIKLCGRQKQQQQQQVIVNNYNKRVRVCPKCGLQNDMDSNFCSDCGYEFKINQNE